jgi:hypothetical protein
MKKNDFVLTINLGNGAMKLAVPKKDEFTVEQINFIVNALTEQLGVWCSLGDYKQKEITLAIKSIMNKCKKVMSHA